MAEISKKTYLLVFLSLLVLLALTVGTAYSNLGAAKTFIAMTIALIKAALVLVFFMHLKVSEPLTWVFAGAGFLWLLMAFVLTYSDYLTRSF